MNLVTSTYLHTSMLICNLACLLYFPIYLPYLANLKLHLYFPGGGWVGVVIIKLEANLSSTSHLTSQLELSLAITLKKY